MVYLSHFQDVTWLERYHIIALSNLGVVMSVVLPTSIGCTKKGLELACAMICLIHIKIPAQHVCIYD